jgi:hypothetical protein
MKLPVLGLAVDERFLNHRLRSTSLGGIVACLLAIGLFLYHVYRQHVWNWELLSIALTMVAVKLAAMLWYHLTD